MASTLYLLSPSQEEGLQNQPHDSPEPRSEPGKLKTRKNPKSNGGGSFPQKKQPQRGLGVAQLERLRLQEQREKIKEASRQVQNPQFKCALPFVDQQNAGAALVRFGYGGGFNEAQASLQCVLQGYRLCAGGRPLFSDPICMDPNFGLPVTDGRFQNHLGELSSNQSVQQCLSDQCGICVKRKRMLRDCLGFNGTTRTEDISNSKPGRDFLGLALSNNNNEDKTNIRFVEDRMNATRFNKKMEIVERIGVAEGKGKSEAETELMEYDFFPLKGGSSNSNSSCSGTRAKSGSSPQKILDLSLKLSSF